MLITITHPSILENEAAAIAALLDGGVDYLHIRKPGVSTVEVMKLIDSIPSEYYPQLTMHYYFDIALQTGLGGLHRSSVYIPLEADGKRLSGGCHSLAELENEKARYSYLFLSPVYDSISKKGYKSPFLKSELRDLLQKRTSNDVPVIALGGINRENIKEVREIGFNGAALLGSIWAEEKGSVNVTESVDRFKRIQEIWMH